jgi:TolB-like protein/DNA-binding SARP family transcriptional activator/Tfp pilus assembly protein PilF
MLHLKTFGGLSVAVDNAPGVGAAQQRKTLALLALLAAAGRTGISRDKLVACLWPEADAEHARGLLKQACYVLRRDLHEPDLFLGTTELRLNPDVMVSDVQAFEAALERPDPAQAAALYAGPFLDGFYLSDSIEFEQWVEAERNRLRQRAGKALETLATDAAARGDHRSAVECWHRLAALDPLNSRITLGLMNALATTGDRAGALQLAQVHERLLREELGAAPDAAVAKLTERLREASAERAPVPPRALRKLAGPAAAAPGEVATGGAGDTTEPERSPAAAVPPARPARNRVTVVLALVVAGLLTGGWFVFRGQLGARSAEPAESSKRLVVLPFANLGTAEDEYFADGITEEITARLAAIDGLRIIGSTSSNVYKGTKKTLLEIGTELGVDYVLEGSVRWQKSVRGQARVRVTPQLVSTTDGTHLWAHVYDEPLDEIFRVQSDIAQKVVQALDVTLREPQRRVVEAIPTRNLEAYDYYLRGNDYARRGTEVRFLGPALRMYEKAVELDSGFALAYAMLARMHARMYFMHFDRSEDRLAQARRSVDRAFELEPNLPEAHHSLADYHLDRLDYDQALRELAIAQASRPNDSRILITSAVLHQRQGKLQEALADFERALQLDPASSPVASNYGLTYLLLRDFPRAEALYGRAIALAPDRPNPYYTKTTLYLLWDGSTRRARAVLDEARTAGVADEPLLLYAQVLVEIFDRRYQEAIDLLLAKAPERVEDQNRFIPRTLLYAQLYGLMRRHDLERAYYDSARSLVLRKIQERPEDPRLHSALGIAYAGLGRKQEAIREGEKGGELLPISREAVRGYHRVLDLARIYAMVGEPNAAVERLEYLLSVPGTLTRAWLRVDPTWDPLRDYPRFQRLLDRRE